MDSEISMFDPEAQGNQEFSPINRSLNSARVNQDLSAMSA